VKRRLALNNRNILSGINSENNAIGHRGAGKPTTACWPMRFSQSGEPLRYR
jgi:hypothetical protein